jgi:transcriptional regulator with XRE-family HTH domain
VSDTEDADDNATTLPRRQLGQYLREARQAVGMKLDDIAPKMQWSPSKVSRFEAGKMPTVRVIDVEALIGIYGIDDPEVVAGLVGLAKQSAGKSWWQAFDDVISGNFDLYVGLESSSNKLFIFRPDMISGLFQTQDYARAVDLRYFPDIGEQELERRVELKIKRQALLKRKVNPVTVELVIHEAVLRTIVGNRAIMAAQCRFLADLPKSVTVRVLTYDQGFPAGLPTGPFTVLDFGVDSKGREIAPTVVYVESYAGDMYLERVKDVARYRQAYSVIQQCALDVAASKRLIRDLAREFSQ